MCDVHCTVNGIAERMDALLLDHDIAVARGVLHVTEGRAELLLTNFGKERRHVAKGATIAYFEEIAGNDDCFVLEGTEHGEGAPDPILDINSSLPHAEQ